LARSTVSVNDAPHALAALRPEGHEGRFLGWRQHLLDAVVGRFDDGDHAGPEVAPQLLRLAVGVGQNGVDLEALVGGEIEAPLQLGGLAAAGAGAGSSTGARAAVVGDKVGSQNSDDDAHEKKGDDHSYRRGASHRLGPDLGRSSGPSHQLLGARARLLENGGRGNWRWSGLLRQSEADAGEGECKTKGRRQGAEGRPAEELGGARDARHHAYRKAGIGLQDRSGRLLAAERLAGKLQTTSEGAASLTGLNVALGRRGASARLTARHCAKLLAHPPAYPVNRTTAS
jgi:hypothetical protein